MLLVTVPNSMPFSCWYQRNGQERSWKQWLKMFKGSIIQQLLNRRVHHGGTLSSRRNGPRCGDSMQLSSPLRLWVHNQLLSAHHMQFAARRPRGVPRSSAAATAPPRGTVSGSVASSTALSLTPSSAPSSTSALWVGRVTPHSLCT